MRQDEWDERKMEQDEPDSPLAFYRGLARVIVPSAVGWAVIIAVVRGIARLVIGGKH